jgi:hypothetical protein
MVVEGLMMVEEDIKGSDGGGGDRDGVGVFGDGGVYKRRGRGGRCGRKWAMGACGGIRACWAMLA